MQTNLMNCWTRHIYTIRIWYASSTKLIYSTKMCRKCIWHFWYGSTLNWRLLHVHSCQPLGIGSNLSRPSTTLYFHAYACVWLGGEKEFVSSLQPISFRAVKKQANRSAWFIFLLLIPHFLLRHFLEKRSIHSSVHSQRSCRSRRLTKTGPLATSGKNRKLTQHTFREDYWTNIHAL